MSRKEVGKQLRCIGYGLMGGRVSELLACWEAVFVQGKGKALIESLT